MRINIDLLRNILLDVADCPAPTVKAISFVATHISTT